jgi:hypothetical protein
MTQQEQNLLNTCISEIEQLTARVQELENHIAELTKGQNNLGN